MNKAKLIKKHRKQINMTQKELAKTLGVSHITVCRWETDFIKPSEDNWILLQNLFGIKKIKPFQKLPVILRREIAGNYRKGISIKNLVKFYNISENTIKNILKSQKIT